MIRLALVLGVIAAIVPGVATAKEIASATVCGASGCSTIDRPPPGLGGGDGISDRVPPVGPYYTVTFQIEEQTRDVGAWSMFWIPSAAVVAFRDDLHHTVFDKADSAAVSAFDELTDGIEPFPAPTIVRGTVNGEPVENPSSYLALFGREQDPTIYPNASDWQRVELTGTRPSPWTDDVLVLVSPTKRIVEVGGIGVARLGEDEAAAVTARAALPSGENGVRWVLFAALSALVVAVAAVVVLLVRAGRRPSVEDVALTRPS